MLESTIQYSFLLSVMMLLHATLCLYMFNNICDRLVVNKLPLLLVLNTLSSSFKLADDPMGDFLKIYTYVA